MQFIQDLDIMRTRKDALHARICRGVSFERAYGELSIALFDFYNGERGHMFVPAPYVDAQRLTGKIWDTERESQISTVGLVPHSQWRRFRDMPLSDYPEHTASGYNALSWRVYFNSGWADRDCRDFCRFVASDHGLIAYHNRFGYDTDLGEVSLPEFITPSREERFVVPLAETVIVDERGQALLPFN